MSFTVTVPVPPSVNNAYINRRLRNGKTIRVLSAEARAYKLATAAAIKIAVRSADLIVRAPFKVLIELPLKMRGDCDNRQKILIDSLVASGRVPDDRHMVECTARKCLGENVARVTVEAAA
jgi:Holliday junction resolvase RusA-like endonuclease